jgi:hypothetical protein
VSHKTLLPELILTQAILAAVEEHGAPNKFHASELTGPALRMAKVKDIGNQSKHSIIGAYRVRYCRGWFQVTAKDQP